MTISKPEQRHPIICNFYIFTDTYKKDQGNILCECVSFIVVQESQELNRRHGEKQIKEKQPFFFPT